eukprot:TRINITY_DN2535_c0_g1_i1.p1 TRINITY_DN2535_c0_g1~~TRINITY_DN2535_c0_g1_i1.p1  ORF type:complete len:334 (-),score=36.26 TRINITY_DN2535_c0_g1_i1:68-1069(-)
MDPWFDNFSDFEAHCMLSFNDKFPVTSDNFTQIDSRLKRILATPLLAASLQAGDGETALLYFGMGGTFDLSQLHALEDCGTDLGSELTYRYRTRRGQVHLTFVAAAEGRSEELRFLLARGVPFNIMYDFCEVSNETGCTDGATPLVAAVRNGHVDCASILIEHRADCNANNSFGITPLHYCVMHRGANSVLNAALLLESRADPRVVTHDKASVIHVASLRDNSAVLELMLDSQCSVNVCDSEGSAALHVAATWGLIESLALLLDHKADTAVRKTDGSTPLHRAAANDRRSAAALLLTSRADATMRNADNQTPAQLAASKGHSEIFELIQAHLG